jgi:hypothetical protein
MRSVKHAKKKKQYSTGLQVSITAPPVASQTQEEDAILIHPDSTTDIASAPNIDSAPNVGMGGSPVANNTDIANMAAGEIDKDTGNGEGAMYYAMEKLQLFREKTSNNKAVI